MARSILRMAFVFHEKYPSTPFEYWHNFLSGHRGLMASHPGIARSALDDEWTTTDVGFWLGLMGLMSLDKQVRGESGERLLELWKEHSHKYALPMDGVDLDLPMEAYPYVHRRLYEERQATYCAYKDCLGYRTRLQAMGLWPAYCVVDAHIWSEV